MRIGDVASRAGVSVRALRYYEEQGLLSAERTSSGQRTYAESVVERVRLIQQFYAAGLSSRTILQVLPCVDTGTATPKVLDVLATERARIAATMNELEQALAHLDRMIDIARHPHPDHCPALRTGQAQAPAH
ncbi:MerR family transcriptional regulator [Sphaerisporangium sp. TRM90804]|uniref:MerR family transcriptional regulator n=1 Tax=Sphaerisporangium sp. TRM90804 TaxID=3031113 RepID=UPI0024491F54|nr:MerR family transcriptional regulator [Sphaerisporangium sp. TRM90804]MDH2425388.1 MerR family transcriptional regulator [Sphaerisporangium sp. TRM90804]